MSDVLHNGSNDMWPEEWKSAEEALVRAILPYNIYVIRHIGAHYMHKRGHVVSRARILY